MSAKEPTAEDERELTPEELEQAAGGKRTRPSNRKAMPREGGMLLIECADSSTGDDPH